MGRATARDIAASPGAYQRINCRGGAGFADTLKARADKATDSPYDFFNWLTLGITGDLPAGMYKEAKDRADHLLDSPEKFADWLTLGTVEMAKGAFHPEESWSAEHWMNSLGVVSLLAGSVEKAFVPKSGELVKPKILKDIASDGMENVSKDKGGKVVEGTGDIRQISSGGLRNEIELTNAQRSELVNYAKKLGFSEENIVFRDSWNTGMMYDRLYINTDVLPAKSPGVGTLNANGRVSGKATIAHEIVGHYEAYVNGKAFNLYDVDPATYARNFALDEAQASIRAARFAPDLLSTERMTLLRDAITRLKNGGLRIRDVKDKLYIENR
ncbi:hypothetical protein [Paenibacillus sp. MMS20-IR301]|uniref:hypothetical protein n=1 Tax=Paenibacillus sp. MMS20-IR301 TaxID=2895946 RepID=UPI0028EFF8AE|nr:hypothetical protein [Paenibacillus sp. MMS20-IR301]WNS41213.1 hypothetical protein LOS79_19445 [Paenibacillus sp. MMS20-IR301]